MDTPMLVTTKTTTGRTLQDCEFRLHLFPGDRTPMAHISGGIEREVDGWTLHGYVSRDAGPRQAFSIPLDPDGEVARLLAAAVTQSE